MDRPSLLWEELSKRLTPSEYEEAQNILGEELIERNQILAEEISQLMELSSDIPSSFPELSRYQKTIDFYLSKISTQAENLGVSSEEVVPFKNPREKQIWELLSEPSSTRPQSAVSQENSPWVPELDHLPKKLDVFIIEEYRDQFKQALETEHQFLLDQAAQMQQQLLNQTSQPTPNEIKSFSKKLEQACVNQLHPAIFQRNSPQKAEPQDTTQQEPLDLEIPPLPSVQRCRPKIRPVKKPSRPSTPLNQPTPPAEPPKTRSKVASRLRSLVNDHRTHHL